MNNSDNNPYKDLEDRACKFAKDCRDFTRRLPKCIQNFEYTKQLIRASGSQIANYIEANEGLSSKDKVYRFKICRKESKESKLWLYLCITDDDLGLEKERKRLLGEGETLRKIYASIVAKYN